MPTMTAEEAQLELRRRLRLYFVKVIGSLIATFIAPFLVGGVLKAAGVEQAAAVSAVLGALMMLGTVAFAWYLVFTTWRCPACDANIYWLVSWNMSAFASMYGKKNCPKCDLQLISPRRGKFVLILIGIAVVFGVLGALMAGGAAAQKRKNQTPDAMTAPNTPNPPPPIPPG